jgi:hypothetical protein
MVAKTKALCISLVAAALLSLNCTHAQELKEQPLHPGDILRFEITFSGPDADKIKQASLNLGLKGSVNADQAGFADGLGAQGQLVSPHIFHVEIKIPENIATGDYVLGRVDASADVGRVAYTTGFSAHLYHVENPRTFTAPTVNVKPLP